MVLNSQINKFCKYFLKYRSSYTDINGHHIGGFKRANTDFEQAIQSEANLQLDVNTFAEVFDSIFNKCNIAPEDCSSTLHAFLKDIVDTIPPKFAQAQFSQSQVSHYSKFLSDMTNSFTGLGIENPFNPQVISATPSQDSSNGSNGTSSESANYINLTPSDQDTLNYLEYLNQSKHLEELFIKLESTLASKLESAVQSKVSEELSKYLGVNKNLTSSEVTDLKNKLGYTYQSILRKENQVLLLETHLYNKTTPDALKHQKFPAPFNAFASKPLFIDNYNKIVEEAQRKIIQLEIKEFKEDINNLNNDIKVFCNILSHHVEDMETTKKDIYNYQSEFLKPEFDSATVKVSRAVCSPFTTKRFTNTHKKSSKQFNNDAKSEKASRSNTLHPSKKVTSKHIETKKTSSNIQHKGNFQVNKKALTATFM